MKQKFTILLFLLLFGCVEKPKVSLEDIKIEGFKKNNINLKVFLNVENPNNFSLEILKASYEIYYKDNIIGEGNWIGPMVLEGGSVKVVGIPAFIKNENFFDILGVLINFQLLGSNEAIKDLKIKGNIVIKKMFFDKKIDFIWSYKKKGEGKDSEI